MSRFLGCICCPCDVRSRSGTFDNGPNSIGGTYKHTETNQGSNNVFVGVAAWVGRMSMHCVFNCSSCTSCQARTVQRSLLAHNTPLKTGNIIGTWHGQAVKSRVMSSFMFVTRFTHQRTNKCGKYLGGIQFFITTVGLIY